MRTNSERISIARSVSTTTFLALILAMTCITLACTNGPKTEDNTGASQANRAGQPAAAGPLQQPTLNGDIERISLYISTARDAAKSNRWQDAAGQLQGANKEVDAALARKPRLREEFEALKAAIDRTLPALERREKDADSHLSELQLRIAAIKTNTP